MKLNAGQRKTLAFCGAWVLLQVLMFGGMVIGVETPAVIRDDQSTISEVMQILWSEQPGAILAVLLCVTLPGGILVGHFFWQNKSVYDAARAQRRARLEMVKPRDPWHDPPEEDDP